MNADSNKGSLFMATKNYLFAPLLVLSVLTAGCNLMEQQTPPNVAETPPYLQPRSELAQSQLAEMRAFHDKESAQMTEEMRVIRNREIERLETAGKEIEQEKIWQDDYEKTLEQREKRSNWIANWFKKKDKKDVLTASPATQNRISSTDQNVR
jgi:hypothetical protein